MTEKLHWLGRIHTGTGPMFLDRDAVHIAVLQIVAQEPLYRAQSLELAGKDVNNTPIAKPTDTQTHGILDPFLSVPVISTGDKAYMFVQPYTITGLKHDWEHPAIDAILDESNPFCTDQGKAEAGRKFLTEFATEVLKTDYASMMEHLQAQAKGGIGTVHLGFDTPDEVYEQRSQIWRAYQDVTGDRPDDESDLYFSCAC